MNEPLVVILLATAITSGTPLLYAALGEILSERVGILNLGVEGMMLVGAVSGYIVTVHTHNHWMGILAAMAAGGLMAAIHAFLAVTLRANQVVSGLALTIFGTGLSSFLGKPYIGQPVPDVFKPVVIPGLSKIPFLGPILFRHDALVYLSFLLVAVLWVLIFHTRWGLNMRAVGENPAAADSMGIPVYLTRYIYVIIGGMLAGIGGAYLSLAYAPSWIENMTVGRGWIAVALVIFAVWHPGKALVGAYIFGGVDSLGFRIQALGEQASFLKTISPFFLQMLPYVMTIIVLIFITSETKRRRVGTPAALGLPYNREER
ncbi:inner-membrane translocator [Thermincola ferriacetica]|uniref:Inner-membrane translocator n=1 Tax=Thermincola ferriacetica TaxID=281456 RepID=A0A0L6VZG3_9FIRM|nr:ABC transporter permease [Thermincola ferriacetica]KNZ68528.1 inner-membrane translocator [Thermincola ferriacetica]